MKKIKVKNRNAFTLVFAILCLLLGFILFFTIVWALPGIALLIVAGWLMTKSIKCPKCGQVGNEVIGNKTFKCKRCNELRLIKWSN